MTRLTALTHYYLRSNVHTRRTFLNSNHTDRSRSASSTAASATTPRKNSSNKGSEHSAPDNNDNKNRTDGSNQQTSHRKTAKIARTPPRQCALWEPLRWDWPAKISRRGGYADPRRESRPRSSLAKIKGAGFESTTVNPSTKITLPAPRPRRRQRDIAHR